MAFTVHQVFSYISSFTSHSHPVMWQKILSQFYRWWNWDSVKINYLLKVALLVIIKIEIWITINTGLWIAEFIQSEACRSENKWRKPTKHKTLERDVVNWKTHSLSEGSNGVLDVTMLPRATLGTGFPDFWIFRKVHKVFVKWLFENIDS